MRGRAGEIDACTDVCLSRLLGHDSGWLFRACSDPRLHLPVTRLHLYVPTVWRRAVLRCLLKWERLVSRH